MKNWIENVIVYEQLHEISNSLSAGYSMLGYSFKDHLKATEWEIKGREWGEYQDSLVNMVLDSEQSANQEIHRLNEEYTNLRAVQNETYFLQ